MAGPSGLSSCEGSPVGTIEPVNHLGLMEGGGVVRVGLAHYNTAEDVDQTLAAIAAHLSA